MIPASCPARKPEPFSRGPPLVQSHSSLVAALAAERLPPHESPLVRRRSGDVVAAVQIVPRGVERVLDVVSPALIRPLTLIALPIVPLAVVPLVVVPVVAVPVVVMPVVVMPVAPAGLLPIGIAAVVVVRIAAVID